MRNWNISSKVALLAFLPTLIVSILLGGYFCIQRIVDIDTHLNSFATSMIEQLEPAAKYALEANNQQILQDLTDTTLENKRVVAASVFSTNGKLLAYSGPDYLMPKNLQSYHLKQTEENQTTLYTQPLILQKATLDAYNPNNISMVPFKGQNLGWISLAVSNSAASYIKIETILSAIIIVILGLILGSILIRLMTMWVTNPLGKINKSILNLLNSNYSQKIYNLPGTELGAISKGLNRIRQKLQTLEETQHDYVSQETNDLKHTLEEIEIQNIELNIALKNAQRDNRRKSEFIASLSHEIRTPMSSIIGFTNLLLESDLTKYQQEYLVTIQKSANTLLAIINDILDFSKIEAGKFKLDNIPFDFIDTLDDVLQSLAPEAQNKQLELIPLFSADIPAKVIGDPLRLKQILTNLVFNAIKFTEEGSVCLKAELLKQTDSSICLEISVIDTGIGLSDKDKKNLFKAFGQADIATARKFGGTGLGLVISKQFIEQMGGTIDIHSKPGIGTTIRFTLNFQALNEPESFTRIPSKIDSTILVYDSHMLSRKAIKQCLFHKVEKLIVVDTFDRIKSQLEEMTEENQLPKRIILSLATFELHNKQTGEMLSFLNKQYGIPVTVLSSTANEAVIKELIDSGAENCVVKPISLKKLLGAICESIHYTINETKSLKIAEPAANYSECKLLIAEDNPANLKLVTSLLEIINIHPETAIDGKFALNACNQNKYSLIFLDLHMPNMGGIEAAQSIRNTSQYNRTTPIVAISAYIAEEDKAKLYAAGFNELLVKPIDVATLEYVINKWSDKSIDNIAAKMLGAPPASMLSENHPKNDMILDLERTIQLSAGNKDLAFEIIQMFMKELPSLTEKMQTYYLNSNWEKLVEVIHKMHGSSRFCAMTKLQRTAGKFEELLRSNANANYNPLYESIKRDITELQHFIKDNHPDIQLELISS